MKRQLKDSTLVKSQQDDLAKTTRSIERCIAETRIALKGTTITLQDDDSEQEEELERLALDRLCDALLDRNVILRVPKR